MISIIHPSRGRAKYSYSTMLTWYTSAYGGEFEIIVSIDEDDSNKLEYKELYEFPSRLSHAKLIINKNKSAVDAINNATKIAIGGILMVVSDDTNCFEGWDMAISKEVEGKTDWILKTQDGIQPWIITMPVMDREYYNRFGYIYHPSFEHMFCDTWMSVMADVTGRRLTSNLLFPHLNDSIKDEVRKKTDATWAQGEKTFINLCKLLPKEDLRKIKDISMINWLRNKGVR